MKIKVDNFELRVLINCMNEKRNSMILNDEDTTLIDEYILKYLDFLEKSK